MEYVPGIKINRIQALDQLGVDRKRYHPIKTNFKQSMYSLKFKNINHIEGTHLILVLLHGC